MGKTEIEWATHTWNPVTGCTRVSAGCDNCYAARFAATRGKHMRQYQGLATITRRGGAAFNGKIRLLPERLEEPLRWTRPRRVFVNSMSDLFHEGVPDDYIDQVFAAMALAPQHVFQVLTKRPVQTSAVPASRVPVQRILSSIAAAGGLTTDPLPKGEGAVLRAVAHYPEGCSRKQLTVLTGYRRSTRDTYLQRLTERGLVTISGQLATVTPAGLEVLGPDFEPLPIGAELLAHWRQRLPEGERKILDVLVSAYPEAVARDAISEATGYARSSRDTYLQRMGAKRLVETEGRGAVRASEMLFDEGAA